MGRRSTAADQHNQRDHDRKGDEGDHGPLQPPGRRGVLREGALPLVSLGSGATLRGCDRSRLALAGSGV